MFERFQVYLNNVSVDKTIYAYRTYIENLLCYNKDSK